MLNGGGRDSLPPDSKLLITTCHPLKNRRRGFSRARRRGCVREPVKVQLSSLKGLRLFEQLYSNEGKLKGKKMLIINYRAAQKLLQFCLH